MVNPERKQRKNQRAREKYHNRTEDEKEKRREYMRLYQLTETSKAKKRDKRKMRHDKYSKKAVSYLGGKCQACGLVDHPVAYDFHHIDTTTKKFTIGGSLSDMGWEKIIVELDKCALLCSHCHRKFHLGLLVYRNGLFE